MRSVSISTIMHRDGETNAPPPIFVAALAGLLLINVIDVTTVITLTIRKPVNVGVLYIYQ